MSSEDLFRENGARAPEVCVEPLKHCPLFQDLTDANLQVVLKLARARRVQKRGFYFHDGERATELYMLVSGKVKLVRPGSDGRQIIMRLIGPSELFGYVVIWDGADRPASAQATEHSQAFAWNAETLVQIMMHHPVIVLNCLRFMAEHIRGDWDSHWDLAVKHVEQRIARTLLRLAHVTSRVIEKDSPIELALSRQDLAELVGTTSWTVSRVLGRWKRLGKVDTGRGRLTIRSPRGLATMAEDPKFL